jgi:two-component system phosphate regulon sensor histidine kinase PhoR
VSRSLTARIFFKLIVGILCVLLVALVAVDLLARRVAERSYLETLERDLAQKGRMLALTADNLTAADMDRVHALAKSAGARITRVRRNGDVVFDSDADAGHMENHAHRLEFEAALAGRVGSDTRTSATMGSRFLYVAVPLHDGALRLAVPLKEVDRDVDSITYRLLTSVVLAFLPAIVLGAFFARYVSRKLASIINFAGNLARGHFDDKLAVSRRDELGILSHQLNVTSEKLKTMVDELETEHQKMEKLERVRKDFVINVSHELRTPLASIQGYTETLLDGALHEPEHNVRFLTIIRQNAERLGRLIADLMTLSQIELKRTKFQFAAYEINELIADCVDSVIPIAEKKDIEISMEPAPRKAEVFCDSEAVHQIISNLLDNAIKYTPQGGQITVGAFQRPTDPAHYEIFVRDTGIGIPPDDLPRLFERFYRVDKARSRELGGTGLGLAIVKHLVQSQGGEVRVSSEVNKGSTFSFTLPVDDLGLVETGTVNAELLTNL